MDTLFLYILPLFTCLCIAYYIFNDEWDDYVGGGAMEVVMSILIGFIPLLNILYSTILIGIYYLKKLKNRKQ